MSRKHEQNTPNNILSIYLISNLEKSQNVLSTI